MGTWGYRLGLGLVCAGVVAWHLVNSASIDAETGTGRWTAQETMTHPLAASGRFTLENTNGSVTVTGVEAGEVRIVATKTLSLDTGMLEWLTNDIPTDAEAQELLKALRVNVEHSPGAVSVETAYPRQRGYGYKVDYAVSVPRSALLLLETTNGAISVREVGGAVQAETTNGAITVEGATGGVSVETNNGAISLLSVAGEIEAESSNGDLRVALDQPALSAPIALETTNGGITLALAAPDFSLDARTRNGAIECGFVLDPGARVKRQQVRGDAGTGGATVQVETTNGPIRILKQAP